MLIVCFKLTPSGKEVVKAYPEIILQAFSQLPKLRVRPTIIGCDYTLDPKHVVNLAPCNSHVKNNVVMINCYLIAFFSI
jgi:hypothetical protein